MELAFSIAALVFVVVCCAAPANYFASCGHKMLAVHALSGPSSWRRLHYLCAPTGVFFALLTFHALLGSAGASVRFM